jgi:restriction endonuclease S subunit
MKNRNENRPGYKRTKVGWIPEDWHLESLVAWFDLSSGITKPDDTVELKSDSAPYPVYGGNGILGYSSESHFSGETILIGRVGEKCGCIWRVSGQYWITDNALYISKWNREANCNFFEYLLDHLKLNQLRNKGGQPLISKSAIKKKKAAVPPLREQKIIAETLSTWDDAIEQTHKFIDAKKHLKKALRQQLLTGKRRLPGFEKTKDQRCYRFFNLPEDWECPQMKEIAQECSDRNTMRGDLPVLACSKHLGFIESSEYFGKRVFSEDTSNYKLIRRGCFGFPSNHIEEGSIGLLLSHDMGLVSPIYTVFRCDESIIPEYLYAVFKTDTFRHIFRVSTNASVDRRGSLRWREFSLIYVPKPSREEQQAIVDILQSADEEINKLEMKLNALEKQKRGLMQKLLTGEVRVKL